MTHEAQNRGVEEIDVVGYTAMYLQSQAGGRKRSGGRQEAAAGSGRLKFRAVAAPELVLNSRT